MISITPSVAHKNTNNSTPMRRSHRRATDGEDFATEAGSGTETLPTDALAGGFSSPTLVGSPAKGSLGSEIIVRKSSLGNHCSDIMHASLGVKAVYKGRP
jgi:hypothetical protein